MKINFCFTISLLFVSSICWPPANAQNADGGPFDLVFEFQAYPTGLIPGLRFEKGFANKNALHLRAGYNWIRHGDAARHGDERGNGFGFTLGYKRYARPGFKGLFGGVRNDLWWNKINWKDGQGSNETSGTTDILVVQPTVEAGWLLSLGPKITVSPSLAFGYEINVKTDGEPTGEGAIFLVGLGAGLRF